MLPAARCSGVIRNEGQGIKTRVEIARKHMEAAIHLLKAAIWYSQSELRTEAVLAAQFQLLDAKLLLTDD